MSYNLEGRLLRRSIPFVEEWIAELSAKTKSVHLTTAATAVTSSAVKSKDSNKSNETAAANKKSGKKQTSAEESTVPATSMSRCCFAIGKVLEVSKHPESTKLYVEKIDLGEELNALTNNEPRVILSGLQEYVKEEEFVNKLVLVIANLEPRKIAGIASNGMVLCASVGDHAEGEATAAERKTVLLNIPDGAKVGERVVFTGHDMPYAPVLKKKLSKCFDEVIAQVKTNDKGEVCWNDQPFMTSAGVITASLPNARIS